MIKDNYPANGGVFVTRLLWEAGIGDRDAFAVIKQASKLKVKRIRKRKKDRLVRTMAIDFANSVS
jgi:hypothetical protein